MKRKRASRAAAYKAYDRVLTLRGEGVIKYVYPIRLRGRITYCVNFGSSRFGVVFEERELTPVGDFELT